MKRTPLKRKTPLNPLKQAAFIRKKRPQKLPRVSYLPKLPKKRKTIHIDPLDALCSEYIRRRAAQRVGGCERCLTPHKWQDLENSHYFGRADQSTRFDSDNLSGLCAGCHFYLGAHPNEHRRWFIQHIGQEAFDMLEGRNRIFGKPDRKLLTLYYKTKIKELE